MQPTPPTPPLATPETVNAVETSVTPETPETPETTLDTSPQTYYQAIGWLRGKLVKGEERFLIEIKDKTFPLYLPRKVFSVANNSLDRMIWVKCYPQSKGEGLSFKVIWMGAEQSEKGEAGIFVLRGVWQFIPQSRRPVFSIYRNELKDYESRPSNQHLPLIWADQPPYRFRKDSEERPKFYQITARLIAQRGCFGFVSQIADPIEQTPRRVKKPPLNAAPGTEKEGFKGDKKEANSTKEGTSVKTPYPKPTKEPKTSPESMQTDLPVTEVEVAIAVPPGENEAPVIVSETPVAPVETSLTLEEAPISAIETSPTLEETPAIATPSDIESVIEATAEKSVPTELETTVEQGNLLGVSAEKIPDEVPVKTSKSTTAKTKTKETKAATEGEPKPKAKRTTKKTKTE